MNTAAMQKHVEKLLNLPHGGTWAYHVVEQQGGQRRALKHVSDLTEGERAALIAQYEFMADWHRAEAAKLKAERDRRHPKPTPVPDPDETPA